MSRIAVLFILIVNHAFAQSETVLKVHFLYGSKPKREFKESERKWFGGILGGHVGIEQQPGQIVSFFRSGKVHWFASRKYKLSRYATHSEQRFYSIFRYDADSVKKTVVHIPVSQKQKNMFDSLLSIYTVNTPYDYAVIGMRCGSATYDLLARMGILKQYGYRKTYMKIFYPRRLRKRLLRKAEQDNWRVEKRDGSRTRKWERDVR